jgi:hypothetical protein
MSDEQPKAAEPQVERVAESGEEDKDRWDELMAKLDAITETLRKACESEPPEVAQAAAEARPPEPAASHE